MRCPKCSALTRVADVRQRQGFVSRRRVCPACGFRFRTHERLAPPRAPAYSFTQLALVHKLRRKGLRAHEIKEILSRV